MRVLIAEDDTTSRLFLFKFLKKYADCDLTVDGFETLDAYLISLKEKNPYDLLFLDIMMPKFDGLKVLKAIRDIEDNRRIDPAQKVKIVLTTALEKSLIDFNIKESQSVMYLPKPVDTNRLLLIMRDVGLIVD